MHRLLFVLAGLVHAEPPALPPSDPPGDPPSPPSSPPFRCPDVTLKAKGWQMVSFHCAGTYIQFRTLNDIICQPPALSVTSGHRNGGGDGGEGGSDGGKAGGAPWTRPATRSSNLWRMAIAVVDVTRQPGCSRRPVAGCTLEGGCKFTESRLTRKYLLLCFM